jgi:tRNA threonylcarbamoyladenosine biosynthesis protein TsaB
MLVLALETATERSSVVLAEAGQELVCWQASARQDLCQRLSPEIGALLAGAGRGLCHVDLVAVGLGPGTFTGLRIGLATAKAIALARDVPLVGVSSLAAMAWQARERVPRLLCPVIDARRSQVYAALYQTAEDGLTLVEPEFVSGAQELAQRLLTHDAHVTVFGQVDRIPVEGISQALGDRGTVQREQVVLPHAREVALLGLAAYSRRGSDDLASLRPIYVRKSYAEEAFDIDLGLR